MAVSLLEYLEQKKLIDPNKANKVRVERTKKSLSEEQIILNLGLVDEETIVYAKSELFKIPYIDLNKEEISERVLAEVNLDSLRKYRAIPFKHDGDVVQVAMVDPFDIQAIEALRRKYPVGTKLSVFITMNNSIDGVLSRMAGETISSEVSDALEDVDEDVTEIDDSDTDELSVGNLKNAPVARIVNSIMKFAVTSSASDIHVEPMETRLRVRFRIHGVMTEKLSLPKNLANPVVSRIKILSKLKIDEKRVPQDGRLPLKIAGHKLDVRVSTLPSIFGEKVVMRLLDSDIGGLSIEGSGLRGGAFRTYLDSIKATNGIILITGPTGSGKTRTLAGTILKLNDPKVNIVTLEDPVEIRIPGVTQVQVKSEIGLTFAVGLRSILRQDPDIVMVGEIRDHETAQLAVQGSLTGHLVLSTLHTNSSSAAIPRLLDMGIESYLLASTLRCVVAQRLPRRICDSCKEEYTAAPEVLSNVVETLSSISNFDVIDYVQKLADNSKPQEGGEEFKLSGPVENPDGSKGIKLYKGKGCSRCGGSGYKGRVGVFEVLTVSEKISRLMMDNASDVEIEKTAIENGMVTMIQDGYLKALEGITTIEEVLRVSRD